MKWITKSIGLTLLSTLAAFTAATISKTARTTSKQPDPKTLKESQLDQQKAVDHFSEALKIKTVSYEDRDLIDYEEFDHFLSFLRKSYPDVYKNLSLEIVNDYGLIFRWEGTDSSLMPAGLISHYDVVPVPEETKSNWTQEPFSGAVQDGIIWGRGSLDDKIGVISILEAAQLLLEQDYQPLRTLYLMFGFDEEINGVNGAKAIAETLKSRGILFDFVLDEGGAIVDNMIPGMDKPIGVVGISEKGTANATLTIKGSGGHAAQPKSQTTIGRLGKAIGKLEETQFPAKFQGPTEALFDYAVPEMSFGIKYVFANKRFFRPLIEKLLISKPATASLVRTTIAPTVFNSGDKANVLPESASANLNLRLMPGESLESVKAFIEKTIDDQDIQVKVTGGEATKVSDIDGWPFKTIQQSARNIYPDVVIAPYLMFAGSDARYYDAVSKCTFRFLPVHIVSEDLSRIHGTDEHVSVQNYLNVIHFYMDLIHNL